MRLPSIESTLLGGFCAAMLGVATLGACSTVADLTRQHAEPVETATVLCDAYTVVITPHDGASVSDAREAASALVFGEHARPGCREVLYANMSRQAL